MPTCVICGLPHPPPACAPRPAPTGLQAAAGKRAPAHTPGTCPEYINGHVCGRPCVPGGACFRCEQARLGRGLRD